MDSIGIEIRGPTIPATAPSTTRLNGGYFLTSPASAGRLFDSLQTAVDLMRKDIYSHRPPTVNVIRRIYETGRTITDAWKERIQSIIVPDTFLPKWNYTLVPQT